MLISWITDKLDRFSCSQKIWLKQDPPIYFYEQQIKSHNDIAHHILKNEVDLIIPQFPTRKEKRDIFTSLITDFIRLAYEIAFCIIEGIKLYIKQ